ncbi:hypothetical protein PLICRDRAFT_45296 [Plicaturopsis crispa FD-325 SS-3]|uniref:Unplaced genomic scaffold PLICRscaffold_15, whole genome shotgun sequence n=1 Tax=Plicaturopsis crispa FD-325 SS-3 TaxID=944288 RepID=A0A0C9SRZ9_PLICR|nr:hypothetical protein PLICRDRAFT_45296 [Plicaturopsis crispa FD-325 SS-3]
MPTTTTTTTKTASSSFIPLKASSTSLPASSSSSPTTTTTPKRSSTSATLRSLYNRAAPAFLHRDVVLTYSLLTSAFALLPPPSAYPSELTLHRRKWDILRITLETTVYAGPAEQRPDTLPAHLREILVQTPHELITSIHARSLLLFTPVGQRPSAAYLPSQILVTLVLSALKLDCADVGREVIEDWLGARGQADDVEKDEAEGYEKVLEVYCLHVLPRVQEWDYAKEFLEYESELPRGRRSRMRESLEAQHAQYRIAHLPPPSEQSPSPSPTSSSVPSRSTSPASTSISSSSLSTTSTHTAVPHAARTPRPLQPSESTASLVSQRTARPSPPSSSHTPHPASTALLRSLAPRPAPAPSVPSTFTLIRASFAPYLTSSRISTFFVLFFVLPMLSLLFRVRRRRVAANVGAADVARRRLMQNGGAGVGVLGTLWREFSRALIDTIRMGGSGLV